jgi:Mn-dependent DtxR family transcriptional regulator
MMRDTERVELTVYEAACLGEVKGGLDGKTKIAIETKQDLKTVAKALEKLSRARLIKRAGTRRWGATEHGRNCDVRVVPNAERRLGGKAFGRLVPGSTADRLLKALDRPMRGSELVERFGVTPQRIHQLIVRFHAQGNVRLGDQRKILHIIARSDDPSLLLTQDQERILSALPDDVATTVPRLAAAARMMSAGANKAVVDLREKGLIEESGSGGGQVHYRLSAEGRVHFQRLASGQRAEPVPLKVRSDRVRSVLSYLAEGERARIKDVRDVLGISHPSMNALMQYLKRKGLVRKTGCELSAPYELTTEGHDTLGEMLRRDQF